MKRAVLTVSLILAGLNLLAWGLSGVEAAVDLQTGLAALCLNGYLFLFLLLGHAPFQKALGDWFGRNGSRTLALAAVLWVPYCIYAAATDSLRAIALLKLLLYLTVPLLIVLSTRTLSNRFHWQEGLVALMLWLPLDFGWMAGVWSWPGGALAHGLSALVGTCLGVLCVACLQGLDGVGYRWRLRVVDVRVAAGYFAVFVPVAIALGVVTGFIQPAERFASPGALLLMALGIFVFIAVPEELLFRGIIQNLLEKEIGRPGLALGVAAVIFGAAHLNNGPSPDWRYFLLATLAGVVYGRAYARTRNLMAPALVHTLVDVAWRGFFR